jgi:hypothetical protein
VKLSFWEQFIIGAAVSFLGILQTQVKLNSVELAGLQAAQQFLQSLLNGSVGTPA